MGEERHKPRGKHKAERIPCKDCRLVYKRESGWWGKLFGSCEETKPLPIRNISRDSVCFLCQDRLERDEKLHMRISLGKRNPSVRVDGKVIRCEEGKGKYPWKIVVGFTGVSEKNWKILCQLPDICPRRTEHSDGWRLHHVSRHESRPKGALHTPDEIEETHEE